MKIYFDMDGVLADFAQAAKNIPGFSSDLNCASQNMTDEQKHAKKKYWLEIEQIDSFWADMDIVDNITELLDFASLCGDLFVLTKTPSANKFADGQNYVNKIADAKRAWIKKHLSKYFDDENIIVCSGKKGKLIRPDKNSILVDDRPDNIAEWSECGGTGILFLGSDDARHQLQKFIKK